MPRGDGTGPNGAGSMTGRRAGYCTGFSVPGFANGGGGRGMRLGRGLRMGFGLGVAAENESEMLKNQAKYLSESLDTVNKRLAQLNTTSS